MFEHYSGVTNMIDAQYHREYYAANRKVIAARRRVTRRAACDKAKEYLSWVKAASGCVDCSEADPVVLDFDHLPGTTKLFNLADGPQRNYSIEKLEAEVKKCEVVCANCHRRRTHARRV